MTFREANESDIKADSNSPKFSNRNTLSNPELVTDNDCLEFITKRGKGWVCEVDNQIVGFAIADLKEHNIWALFVHPDYDKQGIGRQLRDLMLNWYFNQTSKNVWLGTARVQEQKFFTENRVGRKLEFTEKEEVKFEMTIEKWKNKSRAE